ncbi:MAG: thiamine/thiamine pyrophosphate ABC transporter permease ThiP, partial [Alphaproteobacteria bacterium]|nr:thiamine/thiamine pyrophosphate ABC transporter permease ThiP [Alphaproteobacteria bacterium]
LNAIPSEHWRLSAQMGFSSWQRFKLLELPAIWSVLPGIGALIMMMCFTSFAIIMTLGGGPKATTLEVAIYQALSFEYNIAKAVTLAGIQILICAAFAFLMIKSNRHLKSDLSFSHSGEDDPHIIHLLTQSSTKKITLGKIGNLLCILFVLLVMLPPLIALIVRGISGLDLAILMKPAFLQSLLTSLMISLSAGLISICLAIGLCMGLRRIKDKLITGAIETLGSVILVFSPFALATGLFLFLYQHFSLGQIGPYVVVGVNALMALPIAIRVLAPAFRQSFEQTDLLCQSLNISGFNRLIRVDLPLLRAPVGLAFAYAATFSLGDFGIIALFGSESFSTLPLYIYRAMGAYEMGEAAFASLILLIVCYCLFNGIERLIGGSSRIQKDMK